MRGRAWTRRAASPPTSARWRPRTRWRSSSATCRTRSSKGARALTGGKRGRAGPVLRADRARRRRPLDGVHARGDLRPDDPGDEGRATRRRRSGSPTTRPTASPAASGPRTPSAPSASPSRLETGGVSVNNAMMTVFQFPLADGRLEGVRARHPLRRPERHPQVLPPAGLLRRAGRPQVRDPLVPVHEAEVRLRGEDGPAARRARLAPEARAAKRGLIGGSACTSRTSCSPRSTPRSGGSWRSARSRWWATTSGSGARTGSPTGTALYSMPLICTVFYLVHDASFVYRFDEWFNTYDHWYVKLFWAALVLTVAFELVFLSQFIRYGRKELAPNVEPGGVHRRGGRGRARLGRGLGEPQGRDRRPALRLQLRPRDHRLPDRRRGDDVPPQSRGPVRRC